MKKIVWIVFAVLAALWTGLIVLATRLTQWALAAVADARVPDAALAGPAWGVPPEASGWLSPEFMHSLQAAMLYAAQTLNHLLPAAASLAPWLTVLAWLFWGLVMACLLVLALVLHWLAGRNAAASANRQVTP